MEITIEQLRENTEIYFVLIDSGAEISINHQGKIYSLYPKVSPNTLSNELNEKISQALDDMQKGTEKLSPKVLKDLNKLEF